MFYSKKGEYYEDFFFFNHREKLQKSRGFLTKSKREKRVSHESGLFYSKNGEYCEDFFFLNTEKSREKQSFFNKE
ncbi:MAG: hypothetical protein PHO32_07220 [Candidatus Cloacimonetes bacterium]|nr:hypothetical protein [Candidatus Cloacimonadota bacterium]